MFTLSWASPMLLKETQLTAMEAIVSVTMTPMATYICVEMRKANATIRCRSSFIGGCPRPGARPDVADGAAAGPSASPSHRVGPNVATAVDHAQEDLVGALVVVGPEGDPESVDVDGLASQDRL